LVEEGNYHLALDHIEEAIRLQESVQTNAVSNEVEKQEASLQISLTLSKKECKSRTSIIFLCQWITQIIKTEVSRIIGHYPRKKISQPIS